MLGVATAVIVVTWSVAGEQGGVLESSGSTKGELEDRDEGPDVGQHSGRDSVVPSNCLDTN